MRFLSTLPVTTPSRRSAHRRRVRSAWSRQSFSVKLAAIIAVAGVLIAIIPLSLASRENRIQATLRATDKAGIVANLIAGQQASLASFAQGMSEELAAPLAAADGATLQAALLRYSKVNSASDLVGVSGPLAALAARDASVAPATDALVVALTSALEARGRVVDGPGHTLWLLGVATVTRTGERAYIARPVDAAFLRALDGTIATTADPARIALVRGNTVAAAGSTILDQTLAPGAAVDAAVSGTPATDAPAQVVDAGGRQAGVAVRSLGSGFAVLVSTPVSDVSTLWQPLVILLGLIVVAMALIVLVVQTDLQRPLRRLGRAVAALPREEYDVAVPPEANDEIGRLASSFEEMRRQLRATITATRARAAIATELNSPQQFPLALREVCTQLQASSDADGAFIVGEASASTESFVVTTGSALDIDADAVLREDGPLGTAYRHSGPDALILGAAPQSTEGRAGMRDVCVAPLRMGPNVLGVLGLTRATGGYTAADASLVSTSAEQVALALERQRFIAMVQRQASIDDLTGLHNHRFLIDHLGQQVALAERLNTALALLVIDLDQFKKVNDSFGHPVGDSVLSAFASTLSGSIRRADLAARYGGEEFIVIMANTDAAEARLVAEKIRTAAAAMAVPIDGDNSAFITVSIGGAAYPEDTVSPAELLAIADSALYDAKHGGRNRVCMAGDNDALEAPKNVANVVGPRRSAE